MTHSLISSNLLKTKGRIRAHSHTSVFSTIFSILAIILIILPFLVTFNESLTRIVESFFLYQAIQKYIVPAEVRMIGVILFPLGIPYKAYFDGMAISDTYLRLTWNCLGWQSLIFLLITLLVGLQGKFSLSSKLEAIAIGILGTFLVNILRISFIALLGAYFGQLFAILFHDYFSVFVTVIWLFLFWWFSYTFVLEERGQVGYRQ